MERTINYPVKYPHSCSLEEIAATLQTDLEAGLNEEEASKRNLTLGLNRYENKKEESLWAVLFRQFKSPIVYLLAFGAGTSFYFKDITEGFAILIVIGLNAVIGFFMEVQTRRSMAALRTLDVTLTKVIRNGKLVEIGSEKVAPGDIIYFEAGDVIAADGRVIEARQLQCDESSLTGESLPSDKYIRHLTPDTIPSDQTNMVFKGSYVIKGNGKAVVTGISRNTQLGTITSLVENAEDTATPLDKKLNALTNKLIGFTLLTISLVTLLGFLQQKPLLLILQTSIVLAVAAIPEGLPIVSTIALAYGTLLMAKRKVIVKKLSSVETLGGTTVILTDKTGTLTENHIYTDTLAFPEEKVTIVVQENSIQFPSGTIEKSADNFQKTILIGSLCNNAFVESGDFIQAKGDPIEIALLQLATASGNSWEVTKASYPRIAEIPFDSDTKIMGTLHSCDDWHFGAVKGSVEEVLERCTHLHGTDFNPVLTKQGREMILSESDRMSISGLRVLAFAYSETPNLTEKSFLNELVYTGMIGFLDPPRLDVIGAIHACHEAGIKVIMITGDHPQTALTVAKRTGLVDEFQENVISGKDLPIENISDDWRRRILQTEVFARTTPQQKLTIVGIFQEAGNIVAMTGDGVNDAPALKKADVGIAMGLRGTQVAKETADIIVKDDSFNSIAAAVSHGRVVFQNIKKFVVYLISCNLSEILVVAVIGLIVPEATLLPLQILFLNMITDVFPALALGLGKGDETTMKESPRDPAAEIISSKDWKKIAFYALVMTATVLGVVLYSKWFITQHVVVLNNVAFLSLIMVQLFHVFNMSSKDSSFINNEITRNPFVWVALVLSTIITVGFYSFLTLRNILGLVFLDLNILFLCLISGVVLLFTIQGTKKRIDKNESIKSIRQSSK